MPCCKRPDRTAKAVSAFLAVTTVYLWLSYGLSPSYVAPDGVGYFAWLETLFADGDLDFSNQFLDMKMGLPLAATPAGYAGNFWPLGAAFFWLPFYALAVFFKWIFGPMVSAGPRDFALLFSNLGSVLYGLAAAWISHRALLFLGLEKRRAAFAAVLAFAGTPLLFYVFALPNSPHAVSAFVTAFFLFYWMRSFREADDGLFRWALLGAIAGLNACVRAESALFAAAPAMELAKSLSENRRRPGRVLSRGAVFLAAFVLGFSPQMLAWKILYGSAFSSPQSFGLSLQNFCADEVVLSPFHGLLGWTPLFLFSLAGFALSKKEPFLRLVLLVCAALQIGVASFSVAWWGGYSFGIRVLTSCAFPVCMGLGFWFEAMQERPRLYRRILDAACAAMALWTLSLASQAMVGWIDLSAILFRFGTILEWQKRCLDSVPAALRALGTYRYSSSLEVLLLGSASALFAGAAAFVARRSRPPGSRKFLFYLLVAVAAFDLKILRSHLARPPETRNVPSGPGTVAQKDLEKMFLAQAYYTRWYYYLNREDYARALSEVERHLAVAPGSEQARLALRWIEEKSRTAR